MTTTMSEKTGENPKASYSAAAEIEPRIAAAKRDELAFPMWFARVPRSDSSPTSASDISPIPVTATPWSARAPMNPQLESTKGKTA
jgi:hypothetical protein